MFDFVNLDFLTVRLKTFNINSKFWGCVENSPILYLDDFVFDLKLKIEFDISEKGYNVYYLKDNRNNKLAQIIITNNDNKRFDIFNKITFYGLFFNLYFYGFKNTRNGDVIPYNGNFIISQLFLFFGIDKDSVFTRVDLCFDSNRFEVDFFNFRLKFNEKVKRYGTTWKSLQMDKRYVFRVYNKTLDIQDKHLYKIIDDSGFNKYQKILDKNELLTRFELQLNSKIIKEKGLKLFDVLYNSNNSIKIFNNLFINCFDVDLSKIRDSNKEKIKKDVLTWSKYQKKKDFNRGMLRAYMKNVYFLEPDKFRKNLFDILQELKSDISFDVDDFLFH